MKLNIASAAISCVIFIFMIGVSFAQERREIPEFRTYGAPPSQAHTRSIDRFLTMFKIAWKRQDTEALISLHAADTEWINAYARIFRGKAPLAEFLRTRLFPSFAAEVSQTEISNLRPISIRYLGDDVAVMHLYTDGNRGISINQRERLRRTHLHLVIQLQGERWQIVHTAIMDAR